MASVSTRAEPRFTRGIDIAVAVDSDASAESLVRLLLAAGYRAFATVEQEATGRLATVRLGCPVGNGDGVVVDLLFESSGIESEIARHAEDAEIVAGLVLPIASTGHLIALKLLARDDTTRPQDLSDLRALLTVATPADILAAREAVALISHRGFDRGRDLLSALDELASGRP